MTDSKELQKLLKDGGKIKMQFNEVMDKMAQEIENMLPWLKEEDHSVAVDWVPGDGFCANINCHEKERDGLNDMFLCPVEWIHTRMSKDDIRNLGI